MATTKRNHSICRWTFNAGKGGFVPGDMRPSWSGENLPTAKVPGLIRREIAPRLPDHIQLGFELHYDAEVNEGNVAAVVDAMGEAGLALAMSTPGAHAHFAYGGICSMDPRERAAAGDLGKKVLDLTYGPLRPVWHADKALAPSVVLWNGSWGYDLATVAVREMHRHMRTGLAEFCKYEKSLGEELYIVIEPKPNEGHPAMLLPTVASAILVWRLVEEEHGVSRAKKGVNKEIGHSEMVGLDHVYDTVEEIEAGTLHHTHLNSQGYNDGLHLGGPGKYDIDFGTQITAMNIAMAGVMLDAGYGRWMGHDMQARPYDDEAQGIDRVVRSVLSWDACEQAASRLDKGALLAALSDRRTGAAEDIMRSALMDAHQTFDRMYKG
ncbi:MAG: hypothetical protein KF857_01610 [Fimbriimonadaceae bacterium]|nr:hypothetical protein [Fimbriimonadaceae bacterium]